MDDGYQILIIAILVICSSFFSASETAFTGLNKIRLKTMADDGNKKAAKVLHLAENYDRLLSTILIGNNIVNIAASSLATVIFTSKFGGNGSWISTIVMTVIVLICGEILPKSFAKEHSEGLSLFFYPVLKGLIIIFLPLSAFFSILNKAFLRLFKKKIEDPYITEDELLTMIDEIEEEGMIKPYERELISSAIKFDDIEVKEILTPRSEVVAIESDSTIEEIHELFKQTKYTRIPVFKETIDNIIGILHEKDFYQHAFECDFKEENFKLKKILKDVSYVSEQTKISKVFKMFQEKKTHMGVVLDQFDGTLGIVTLEDIIEELVGEIWDETDEIFEETKQIGEDEYLVSGKEMLDDAFEIIGIEKDDEEENQTVNSWLSRVMERIPTAGDNFLYQDEWKITVLSATKKGAIEIKFKKI